MLASELKKRRLARSRSFSTNTLQESYPKIRHAVPDSSSQLLFNSTQLVFDLRLGLALRGARVLTPNSHRHVPTRTLFQMKSSRPAILFHACPLAMSRVQTRLGCPPVQASSNRFADDSRSRVATFPVRAAFQFRAVSEISFRTRLVGAFWHRLASPMT